MTHITGNIDDFAIDTASLAGPLDARLEAVKHAGFSQVLLHALDLTAYPLGVDAAVGQVLGSGLQVAGLCGLADYEGLSGAAHHFKLETAKALLSLCEKLQCRQLLLQACSYPAAPGATTQCVIALRKLAMLAITKQIRVVYCACTEAPHARDFAQAWDLVCEADMPNLGLGLGNTTVLEFVAGQSMDELEMLDVDKVFLVHLADFLEEPQALATTPTAALESVFAGEGIYGQVIAAMVTRLHSLGYRASYNLAADHADYRQISAASVAHRAKRAALWLGEQVLERSVPLPNSMRLKKSRPV
jgi:sugar phosphate isomerase/epimerase